MSRAMFLLCPGRVSDAQGMSQQVMGRGDMAMLQLGWLLWSGTLGECKIWPRVRACGPDPCGKSLGDWMLTHTSPDKPF